MAGAPYPHDFIAVLRELREDREFTIRFAHVLRRLPIGDRSALKVFGDEKAGNCAAMDRMIRGILRPARLHVTGLYVGTKKRAPRFSQERYGD